MENRITLAHARQVTRGFANNVSSIDYSRINAHAMRNALNIHRWIFPEGKIVGAEYVVRNPRRSDRSPGSFKINLRSGRWADFAIPDTHGGDLVSLVGYVRDLRPSHAARELAAYLRIEPEVR